MLVVVELSCYETPNGTEEKHIPYAHITAEYQNSGKMDDYMSAAVALAKEMGVSVADCYRKWKELAKTQDTTMLLDNRINHPTRQMQQLFADTLFETIFGEASNSCIAATVRCIIQKRTPDRCPFIIPMGQL